MNKTQVTMQRTQVKGAPVGHSDKLKSDLAVLGRTLQARPAELRGPFNVVLAQAAKK